ncbi:MAG: DUF4254 domain-containing protein [Legionellales bacterium]
MPHTINSSTITELHHDCILAWKATGIAYQQQGVYQLVEENHAFNYQLWHAEDKARRNDMGYEFVCHAKREIDHFNQQRNNRMEALDEWIFNALQPAPADACPVNSESPGMMIDRLSILSLKSYHMALQTERRDVDQAHRNQCQSKVGVIQQQLQQLQACLKQLLEEVVTNTRTFRVYHQFKMYNDPTLNPELSEKKR